ncbi:MAG TPA: hypothetical protein VHW92_02725 [Mycobacteriales bacterium]|nr:hypothetical protein [Mycobacteriales bacterium]
MAVAGFGGWAAGRALRVDADRVDNPVDTDPTGQLPHHLDRIIDVEVDHLGVLFPRGRQSGRDPVDDEHRPAPRRFADATAN